MLVVQNCYLTMSFIGGLLGGGLFGRGLFWGMPFLGDFITGCFFLVGLFIVTSQKHPNGWYVFFFGGGAGRTDCLSQFFFGDTGC